MERERPKNESNRVSLKKDSAWKNLKDGEGFKQGGLQPLPLFVVAGSTGALFYGIYKLAEAVFN